MATQNTEIAFLGDGRVIRRRVSEEDIDITESVLNALNASAVTRIRNVFDIPELFNWNLAYQNNIAYYSTVLPTLPLKCAFKPVNGVLVPVLDSSSDPVLAMVWTPPNDMILDLLFRAQANNGAVLCNKCWLFARHGSTGDIYKLPLGNLYDDSSVCTGRDNYIGRSGTDVAIQLWDQIKRSQWNADLWRNTAETQRMFRYSADNKGFRQLPIEAGHWTSLSLKISVSAHKMINL